jgi:EAL domain-containing protein (putative c-di-GMP-specific phosphodiesterase class I)
MKSGFVTVEVATRQLLDPGLAAQVMRTINENRIKPDSLVLTIDDSTLSEVPERFEGLRNQLAQWSIPVAVNHSGNAALAPRRLQARPVTYLRVARSVVAGVMHDENCAAMARALLATGRQLGLTTLGEGADSQAQVRFLQAHGCELATGAFFAKAPMTGEELLGLKRQTWRV